MLTSYQFASNTPIYAIDLDGLEGTKHVEVEKASNGRPVIRKITYSLDVYLLVGTSGDYYSTFAKDDVGFIQKGLNSIFSEDYVDPESGAPVVFDVKVKYLDFATTETKTTNRGRVKIRNRPTNISLVRERYNVAVEAETESGLSFPALVASQVDVPGTDGGKASAGIKIADDPSVGQVLALTHELMHYMLSLKKEGDDHNLKGILGRPFTSPYINHDILRELFKAVPNQINEPQLDQVAPDESHFKQNINLPPGGDN